MKILVLGDTHGRNIWKEIVKKESPELTIFIGDYFDSFNISAAEQIYNFKEIIEFKKNNDVIMLTGNHDYHYLQTIQDRYSGYQSIHAFDIQDLLETNLNYLQMVYIHDGILFSHAGVTKTWMKTWQLNSPEEINELFKYKRKAFEFQGHNIYGDDITQSPIWVRESSLRRDKIDFPMVVGHTQLDKLLLDDEVTMIDTLGTSGEYLKIENKNYGTGSVSFKK